MEIRKTLRRAAARARSALAREAERILLELRGLRWRPHPGAHYFKNKKFVCSNLLLLFGAFLLIPAVWRIVSPLRQSAPDFWAANHSTLILSALGGVSILLGALLSVPASLYAPPRQTARFNSRPTRRRIALARAAGGALIAGSVPLYWIAFAGALAKSTGLLQVAGLLAAIAMSFGGILLLEIRRRRRLVDDLALRVSRRELLFLCLFLFIWFCVMAWRLDTRPGFFHGDEATVVAYGRNTRIQAPGKPWSPWVSWYAPALGCVPRAFASDALRSRPYLGPRLVTLAISIFAMGLIFAFARNKIGRLGAWLTLFPAATHHIWIAFSRMGILNVDGAALITLCVVFWLAAFRSRRRSLAYLAGALCGLSFYTYHGALLALPLIAALTALDLLIQPRRILRRWSLLLLFGAGLACAAAPFKMYYRLNPADATYHPRQVSLLYSPNLVRQLSDSKMDSVPDFLLYRAWLGVVGTLIWPDTSSNYVNRGFPLINRGFLGLILAAALACIPLLRTVRLFASLFLWIALTLALGAVLAANPEPPYAPRVFMMLPALYILAGWFSSMLVAQSRRLWGQGAALAPMGAAALLMGTIAQVDLHTYFGFYLRNIDAEEYHSIPTGMMAWMNKFPRDATIVFIAPHMFQIYTAYMEMFDGPYERVIVNDHGSEIPEPKNPKGVAYVFKLPEFAEAEAKFAAAHPGVSPTLIRNPYVKDPPMYSVYWLPPPPGREAAGNSEGLSGGPAADGAGGRASAGM